MVLGEHETAQFRSEMPVDAGRKWGGDHVAIRRLPALTAKIDDMRMDYQILHHDARVALKPRAERRRSLDNFSSWIVSFDFVLPRLPCPSPVWESYNLTA